MIHEQIFSRTNCDTGCGGGGDVGEDRAVWSGGSQCGENLSEDENDGYADSGDSGVHQIHT